MRIKDCKNLKVGMTVISYYQSYKKYYVGKITEISPSYISIHWSCYSDSTQYLIKKVPHFEIRICKIKCRAMK
jgi:hypothetical protein